MQPTGSIRTWLESSVSAALRGIVLSDSNYFVLENDISQADIIIFENDEPTYVRQTIEYKQFPEKCIAISESDRPSYFLPACYSSNRRTWLGYKRAQTIPYYITQQATPNPYIEEFNNTDSRRYLYSFKGGSTSWVRKKLFKLISNRNDVCIEEANHYHHWNNEESYIDQKKSLQREYADLIGQSSFVLCPCGAGVSSIRLFEVMQAGRVPVIISDSWVPVIIIPWNKFSLQIQENNLANLDNIIRNNKHVANDFGLKARQAWVKYCAPNNHSRLLAQSIQIIQQNRSLSRERILHFIFPIFETILNIKSKIRSFLKYIILNAFVLTGRKFPYSLNRPIEERIHEMKSKNR